jgi:hypothetical protein
MIRRISMRTFVCMILMYVVVWVGDFTKFSCSLDKSKGIGGLGIWIIIGLAMALVQDVKEILRKDVKK